MRCVITGTTLFRYRTFRFLLALMRINYFGWHNPHIECLKYEQFLRDVYMYLKRMTNTVKSQTMTFHSICRLLKYTIKMPQQKIHWKVKFVLFKIAGFNADIIFKCKKTIGSSTQISFMKFTSTIVLPDVEMSWSIQHDVFGMRFYVDTNNTSANIFDQKNRISFPTNKSLDWKMQDCNLWWKLFQ